MSSELLAIEFRVSTKIHQILLSFDTLKQRLAQTSEDCDQPFLLSEISQLRANVQTLEHEAAALFCEGFQENGSVLVEEDTQISDELEAQEFALKSDISAEAEKLLLVEEQMKMKQEELEREKLCGSSIVQKFEEQKACLRGVEVVIKSLNDNEERLLSRRNKLTEEIQAKEEEINKSLRRIDVEMDQLKTEIELLRTTVIHTSTWIRLFQPTAADVSCVVRYNNRFKTLYSKMDEREVLLQNSKQEISKLKEELEKLEEQSLENKKSLRKLESKKFAIQADRMGSLDEQIQSVKNLKDHQERLVELQGLQKHLSRTKNNLQLKLAFVHKQVTIFGKDSKRFATGIVSVRLAEQAGFSIESYCLLLGFQVDLLHHLISSAEREERRDIHLEQILVQLCVIERMLLPLRFK